MQPQWLLFVIWSLVSAGSSLAGWSEPSKVLFGNFPLGRSLAFISNATAPSPFMMYVFALTVMSTHSPLSPARSVLSSLVRLAAIKVQSATPIQRCPRMHLLPLFRTVFKDLYWFSTNLVSTKGLFLVKSAVIPVLSCFNFFPLRSD